jgi:hypothetical protein
MIDEGRAVSDLFSFAFYLFTFDFPVGLAFLLLPFAFRVAACLSRRGLPFDFALL